MAKKQYELLIQDGKIVGVSKTFGYGPIKRLKHGRTAILLRTMEDALQALENAAAGEFVPITAREASLIKAVTQDTFLDAGPEAVVYVEDIVARLKENRRALRDAQIRNGLPTLNSPEEGKVLFGAIIAADKVDGDVLTRVQSYLETENCVAYVWANSTTEAIEELGFLNDSLSWVNHVDGMGAVCRPWGVRYGRFYEDIPELTAAHFVAAVTHALGSGDASRERTRRLNIERDFDAINTPDDGQMLYGAFIITDDNSEAVVVWADSEDDAESRLRTAGYVQIADIEEVGDDGMFGM
ncbi:hypothetical protein [Brevibacillus laterosporus]|uniref:hypothetical protein n=1 Tax=Brevibacillus laterosporus TaxID=1465 RepID=UPI001EF2D37B|nr:hypothetical protein [Brevibacillus laterosporus]MCG7319618.1 hypothetical protein [Brevibacillus laterosporus]